MQIHFQSYEVQSKDQLDLMKESPHFPRTLQNQSLSHYFPEGQQNRDGESGGRCPEGLLGPSGSVLRTESYRAEVTRATEEHQASAAEPSPVYKAVKSITDHGSKSSCDCVTYTIPTTIYSQLPPNQESIFIPISTLFL